MKRLGLILLAVAMVAGLAGCPNKDSPDVQGTIGYNYYTNGYVNVGGEVVNVGSEYASNVRVTFRFTDAASGTQLCAFTANIGTVLENERRSFNRWYGCPPIKGSYSEYHDISWD